MINHSLIAFDFHQGLPRRASFGILFTTMANTIKRRMKLYYLVGIRRDWPDASWKVKPSEK